MFRLWSHAKSVPFHRQAAVSVWPDRAVAEVCCLPQGCLAVLGGNTWWTEVFGFGG